MPPAPHEFQPVAERLLRNRLLRSSRWCGRCRLGHLHFRPAALPKDFDPTPASRSNHHVRRTTYRENLNSSPPSTLLPWPSLLWPSLLVKPEYLLLIGPPSSSTLEFPVR